MRSDAIKETGRTQEEFVVDDNLAETSKLMTKDDAFNGYVLLPQSSTETIEKKSLISNVNIDTSDDGRIPSTSIPARPPLCASVKYNEITLPSIDKLMGFYTDIALKEIKESKCQKLLIIKDFNEKYCSVMFTDKAIEHFTALNISREELNIAIKHTAPDNRLYAADYQYMKGESYYIDNQSIITEYENTESVEHFFCYSKDQLNTTDISRPIDENAIVLESVPDVLFHNNYYHILRENDFDYLSTATGYFSIGADVAPDEVHIIYDKDKYILYTAMKHYHKLMSLVSSITSSSSSPEIINHLHQVIQYPL